MPVWNGLTDMFHPTQMLADIMTAREEFGDLRGRKLTFFGDARNNVANSLMVVSAKLGMHFCACGPKDLMPSPELVEKCQAVAAETGATITLTEDVKEACTGANVIYTDIWVSMGEPAELWAERIKLLEPYRVTKEVMAMASPDAIFMHCLPSFHDTKTTIGAEIAEQFGVSRQNVHELITRSVQKLRRYEAALGGAGRMAATVRQLTRALSLMDEARGGDLPTETRQRLDEAAALVRQVIDRQEGEERSHGL